MPRRITPVVGHVNAGEEFRYRGVILEFAVLYGYNPSHFHDLYRGRTLPRQPVGAARLLVCVADKPENGRTSTAGEIVTDPNVNEGEGASATSLSLLERACKRDPAAWVQLTEFYGPMLDRGCLRAGLRAAE